MPKRKRYLALIGDLVESKQITDRYGFQSNLSKSLSSLGEGVLASPYTLTLGDEFQALYNKGTGVFYDVLALRLAIYPIRCRFSFAIGEITTPVNKKQAIGMDGPAFHIAREQIETLKKTEDLLAISGLEGEVGEFVSSAMNLLWASTESWNDNRLKIMLNELKPVSQRSATYPLHITQRAINKNIRDARIVEWVDLVTTLEIMINQGLRS